MSHLQYYAYEGYGVEKRKELWYSQAVRVDNRIECAGQGGWDPATSKVHADFTDEVEQAFSNVDLALKDAGGKGWSQVYRVNAYLVEANEETIGNLVRHLKKWTPDHQPIVTLIGVTSLGLEGMRIEIEVVAHDEEGARAAAAERAAK